MSTQEFLSKLFFPKPSEPPKPISPGLYHYMRSAGQESYSPGAYTRFHLRIDPDGRGLLLANASAALHLSPSGVVIAKGLLDDLDENAILERLKATFYGASEETMTRDLERVSAFIERLVAPGDNYPVMNLEDAVLTPYEAELMAPLQADVVMAPLERLLSILEKLWQVNIPHVNFMMAPQDSTDDLVLAIERAEDLGMIAGVRGRATDLNSPSLVEQMAMAGLDHCNVLLATADPDLHDEVLGSGDHALALAMFRDIKANEIAPVAEVPLLEDTLDLLVTTLDLLLQRDVSNVNFLAIAAEDEMLVEELASELDVRFIWQPPVQRDPELTVAEQLLVGPRCTADVSVRIESNGDVIPPRGRNVAAGNILQDTWEDIWGHPAFLRYRERVERPTRCEECPGLVICAVDCPREPAGWSLGVGGEIR